MASQFHPIPYSIAPIARLYSGCIRGCVRHFKILWGAFPLSLVHVCTSDLVIQLAIICIQVAGFPVVESGLCVITHFIVAMANCFVNNIFRPVCPGTFFKYFNRILYLLS